MNRLAILVLFSSTTLVLAQFLAAQHSEKEDMGNNYGDWPDFGDGFPFGHSNPFQGGVFSPDWGTNLARQIEEATRNAARNGGSSVITNNGVSTITVNINGRTYTAQLPANSQIATHSSTYTNSHGQHVEVVTVRVNGDTSTYTTVNGQTTVTDGNGNPRRDGGPFHITSIY